jgi:signal transduction histidine kinase
VRSFQDLGLRAKMTVAGVGISVTALLLAGLTFMAFDAYSFRQKTIRDLTSLTGVIARSCEAALLFDDDDAANGTLAALSAQPAVEQALLYGRSGQLFAEYRTDCRSQASPGTIRQPAADHPRRGHQTITHDVTVDGEPIGRLVIVADLQELDTRARRYAWTVGLVLFLFCGMAWLLTRLIHPLVSRAILRLADTARMVVERRDFSIRVTAEGRDEVTQVGRAFNELLDHVEERDQELRGIRRELEAKIAQLEAEVAERRRAEEALRRSEEQLLQAQKMDAVGRLAGGVAHDFNNLLTVIRGQGDLLARHLVQDSPENRHLGEIRKAADRAAGLTRQLLAFSRKQILTPKVVDVRVVVTALGSMLGRLIGEDIKLENRMPDDLGRVRIDPGQLEQAIMNLAINARDAMPEGGRLLLEASNVRRHEDESLGGEAIPAGDYVVLAVTDTGCGMSREVIQRIFEPFFTTKPTGKGTGLGLSMVYGIVRQSGGYITVYSEPGTGTTFRIYLPRVDAVPETAADPDATPEVLRGRGETILVVEDEAPLLGLITEILGESGYHVLPAADGAAALRVCAAHPGDIHLAVSDVVMPGMNGRQVAQELARLRPGLRVLYISGYSDTGIVHGGQLDEGVDLLQKPFSPMDLLGRLRDILDRDAPRRAA